MMRTAMMSSILWVTFAVQTGAALILPLAAHANCEIRDGQWHLDYIATQEDLMQCIGDTNPNEQDEDGWTALHMAATTASPDVIRALLEKKGARVDAKDRYGRTPLHVAVSADRSTDKAEVIGILLKEGADRLAKDNHGSTPLHRAAAYNFDIGAFRKLLSAYDNSELNDRNKLGYTALDYTRLFGNSVASQALADSGAAWGRYAPSP